MKHQVTRFKSLKIALKNLEPFIRNGEHLQTGKPFKRFELRSRELLANWLLCVAVNSMHQPDRLMFTSDPLGGDGIIHDTVTGETWPTEHVLVPSPRVPNAASVEMQILNAIGKKNSKGAAYASGKMLVVFLNAGGGEWYPNKVARQLPAPIHFESVWVVGLQGVEETDKYIYAVTELDLSHGNAPAWRIRVGKDFNAWEVELIK